ncbi:hypothetical protein cypCar_00040657 [Cyprinus carpio]|nr:hypothetical protein cypCar_00040657 [Cyprinus carpio]
MASSQELDEYHRQANIWLQVLDEEIKLGESLKEEDFLEDAEKISSRELLAERKERTFVRNTIFFMINMTL